MELDDSDAPNKFDVTGRVISETNVTRSELRAHNERIEQERRTETLSSSTYLYLGYISCSWDINKANCRGVVKVLGR